MEFSSEDTYSHSVIEVAEKIHSSVSGSGDVIPDGALSYYVKWLEWRTGTEVWAPSHPRWEEYDKAVWALAICSLNEGRAELERINSLVPTRELFLDVLQDSDVDNA